MSERTYSTQTITALAEVVTGGPGFVSANRIGLYRTGPELDRFFGGLNIDLAIGNGSRVPTVRATLTAENKKPAGHRTITRVIEAATDPREFIGESEKLAPVIVYLNERLAYDGYELRPSGKLYRVFAVGVNTLATATLGKTARELRLEAVEEDFERAVNDADRDPPGAVTAACSTLESVCKTILDELEADYPSKKDVQHLSRAVADQLGLSPARGDLPPELAQDLRQILGGLQTVAGGVGALRTHFGDAHGHGKVRTRVGARIARLAIHAASTLALFYIETWQRTRAGKKA